MAMNEEERKAVDESLDGAVSELMEQFYQTFVDLFKIGAAVALILIAVGAVSVIQ